MKVEDIMALPVQGLADHDCALFMWVTWPTIQDALRVGNAWGFTYKTCAFLWAKSRPRAVGLMELPGMPAAMDDPANWFVGMGYWSRANTEAMWLFTRGQPKRKAADVRQLLIAPIGEHSAKPDEQYNRIEALVDGPYLEMFARRKRAGWHTWGNEVPNDVELQPETLPAIETGSV
jgi:N6-adenosine-specific RNA methylase IME4